MLLYTRLPDFRFRSFDLPQLHRKVLQPEFEPNETDLECRRGRIQWMQRERERKRGFLTNTGPDQKDLNP